MKQIEHAHFRAEVSATVNLRGKRYKAAMPFAPTRRPERSPVVRQQLMASPVHPA